MNVQNTPEGAGWFGAAWWSSEGAVWGSSITARVSTRQYLYGAFPLEGAGRFGAAWWSSQGAFRRSSDTARVFTADSTLMEGVRIHTCIVTPLVGRGHS